jgi:hypothetical protein
MAWRKPVTIETHEPELYFSSRSRPRRGQDLDQLQLKFLINVALL